MICRVPCLAILLGFGAVLASAAEPAKAPLDNLVKNSPFGTGAAPAPGTENSQLEFRGMFTDQGEQFFSFFDPATRTSQWVSLKETGTPYTVQGYDSATQTVKVLFHNQTFNLSLKRSQIVVQALPPPPPMNPGQPVVGGPPPVPAVGAPVAADEAARLAQVAEEIRRRRALRAQGGGTIPAPQPVPTSSSPGPQPTPNRP